MFAVTEPNWLAAAPNATQPPLTLRCQRSVGLPEPAVMTETEIVTAASALPNASSQRR
jgi:hypothetical protein